MLPEWEWLSPTVWFAFIVAIALLLIFGGRRGARRGQRDEFHVRHEIIDECFAKGEMTREECERGCAAQGNCHASPSVTDSRQDALFHSTREKAMRLFRIRLRPFSAWTLLGVGLILMIEPLLPWYHFSPFWFSLGVLSAVVALFDIVRRR